MTEWQSITALWTNTLKWIIMMHVKPPHQYTVLILYTLVNVDNCWWPMCVQNYEHINDKVNVSTALSTIKLRSCSWAVEHLQTRTHKPTSELHSTVICSSHTHIHTHQLVFEVKSMAQRTITSDKLQGKLRVSALVLYGGTWGNRQYCISSDSRTVSQECLRQGPAKWQDV